MRRIICLSLVMALLVGFALPAGAAGTPTLSISSGSVKAGEIVDLSVSIKDNPGIAACLLYVYFDTDAFDVSTAQLVGEFKSSGSVIQNTIEKAKTTGQYDGASDKDGILVVWYDKAGSNVESDGNIFTIKLKAKEDIQNGNYTVGVGYSNSMSCDENGQKLLLSTKSGKISVSGGEGQKTPDSEQEKTDIDVPQFTDIDGNWAEDYIKMSAAKGLVEGYQGLYRPNDTMTRAEFVTILWRAMGEPKPAKKASFTDLTQDWYKDAVAWAEQNQVVNGMGGGLFEPNGKVTREQLVTILHRLAGTPSSMATMFASMYDSQFKDSANIGSWAKNAMYWAVYNGIYCGRSSVEIGSDLYPKSAANRAQIAVMMIRFLES